MWFALEIDRINSLWVAQKLSSILPPSQPPLQRLWLPLWADRLPAVVTHFRTVTRFISPPSFGLKINMKIVFTCRQVEGISQSLFSFFLSRLCLIYLFLCARSSRRIVSYRIVSCDWPRQLGAHSRFALRCLQRFAHGHGQYKILFIYEVDDCIEHWLYQHQLCTYFVRDIRYKKTTAESSYGIKGNYSGINSLLYSHY